MPYLSQSKQEEKPWSFPRIALLTGGRLNTGCFSAPVAASQTRRRQDEGVAGARDRVLLFGLNRPGVIGISRFFSLLDSRLSVLPETMLLSRLPLSHFLERLDVSDVSHLRESMSNIVLMPMPNFVLPHLILFSGM